eukprot:7246818-Pyramimonas_sp.AAC.1
MESTGVLRILIPWGPMHCDGVQWSPMKSHGLQWIPKESDRGKCNNLVMESHEVQWSPMEGPLKPYAIWNRISSYVAHWSP